MKLPESKKTRTQIAALIALTLLIVMAYLFPFSSSKIPNVAIAIPVQTMKIKKEKAYKAHRYFTGTVESRKTSILGFELEGKLLSVLVEEGQEVEQGELLAKLDTALLEADRNRFLAKLAAASAEQQLAETTLARFEKAARTHAVSKQELDDARQRSAKANATAKEVAYEVERIDVALKKSGLYAPYSGTIIKRWRDEGTVLDAATSVLTLQEKALPKVRVSLPGELVENFSVGDTIQVILRGEKVNAQVIGILPVRDLSTRTMDLILESEVPAIPGDLIVLRLSTKRDYSGFWVPLSALTESIRGLWIVYVPVPVEGDTHRVETRLVEVVYTDGNDVYITGNLKNGEGVIYDGLRRVVPGQEVRLLEDKG